ncbi:unnamed protein product, partial [Symbiodinium pilosum]
MPSHNTVSSNRQLFTAALSGLADPVPAAFASPLGAIREKQTKRQSYWKPPR